MGKPQRRPVFEELERRVLLSADSPLAGLPALFVDPDGDTPSLFDTDALSVAQHTRDREIVFIDSAVANADLLLAGIRADTDAEIEVVLLDADDDLSSIGEQLSGAQDLRAIHIISHGAAGSVAIGADRLDAASLIEHATAIAGWGAALNGTGDILFYGCDLAANAAGRSLIADIAALTGADVAASVDRTGHRDLGADWELEYQIGLVDTQVIVGAHAQATWTSSLATITVTTTSDAADGVTLNILTLALLPGLDGAISLREAIIAANNTGGTDTIEFSIAGAGPHTINLLSGLPAITDTLIIDATSEPGYAGTPLIELNGTGAGAGTDGLKLNAGSDGSTILGLAINRFNGDGIEVQSDDNTIAANFIGTDPGGTIDRGNNLNGIWLRGSDNNTIGGSAPGDGNLISGNQQSGVLISLAGANANVLAGNRIGTDVTGLADLGNTGDGVFVAGTASSNVIGGLTGDEQNIIGGNNAYGVHIQGAGTTGNIVRGNHIGVDAGGHGDLGNSLDGVFIESGATGNTIGGTAGGADNVISGNDGNGVRISGIGTSGNTVLGNFIGTDHDGLGALANTVNGVLIEAGATGNTIGGVTAAHRNIISANGAAGIRIDDADANTIQGNYIGTDLNGAGALGNAVGVQSSGGAVDNVIGGTAVGAGNLIANSTVAGVAITGAGTVRNAILGNSIRDNGALGIDLANNGVTRNDPNDGDSGQNDLLNFPVLTGITQNGANLDLVIAVDLPAGTYRIELFENPAGADDSGFGQGQIYLGAVSIVVTGAAGYEVFARTLLGVTPGAISAMSATATRDLGAGVHGSTSEFGPAFAGAGVLVVTTTADVVDGDTASVTKLLGNRGVDGEISLREAIIATNNTGGAQTIEVPGGTYTATLPGTSEDGGQTGDFDILDDVSIIGAGAGTTIIDGGGFEEVLTLYPGTTVSMSGITITGGDGASHAGGIHLDGALTLTDVVISGNQAGRGAGIYMYGGASLTLNLVTISGNAADNRGGGIYAESNTTVAMTNATVSGNTANNDGGGVYFEEDTTATLTNVTISGNTSDNDGGGLYFNDDAIATLINVTISGNIADNDGGGLHFEDDVTALLINVTIAGNAANNGGGIYNDDSDVSLKNTILAGNTGGNAAGTLISLGHNLDSGNTAAFAGPGDLINTNPLLGSLQLNGGSTATRALLAGSPAIAAGTLVGAPLLDQRGVARDGAPDIGAYESTGNNPPAIAGLSGDVLAYTEGDGARLIDQGGNAVVSDADSVDFDGGNLTVAIVAGGNAVEDVLGIRDQGAGVGLISLGGSNVLYDFGAGAVAIGSYTGGSAGVALVVTFNGNATPAAVTALIRNITYTNTDNANPAVSTRTVQFSVDDGDGAASSAFNATITMARQNDAPVIAVNAGLTVAEDGSGLISNLLLAVNDVDNGAAQIVYQIGAVPVVGELQLSGVALGNGGFFTQDDINAGRLGYVHDGDQFSVADGFTFTVSDGAGGNIAVQSFAITINLDNDAPVITGLTGDVLAYTEGDGARIVDQGVAALVADIDAVNFGGGDLNVSIVAGGVPAEDILGVRDQGAGVGNISVSGSNVRYDFGAGPVVIGSFTGGAAGAPLVISFNPAASPVAVAALLRNISYTNADNDDPDTTTRTLQFSVSDGVGATSATHSATVTVARMNDVPVLAANTGATLAEGGTVTVTNVKLAATDVDNSAAQLTYTVNVVPVAGELRLSGVALVAGGTFTQDDVDAGRIAYVHNGGEGGSDAFTFAVSDGAGGSIAAQVFSFSMTPINDAPVITSNGGGALALIDIAENTATVTTMTALDVDLPAQPLNYTIVGGTDAARFTIDAGGTLCFLAAPDFEAPNDSDFDNVYVVDVQVDDGNGGSDVQTLQITVVDGNELPSGADAGITTAEDTPVTLLPADFGFSDPDPADSLAAVRIDVLPAGGELRLDGIAVVGSALIDVADIGAGKLVFTPAANASGVAYATIGFTVQDQAGLFAAASNQLVISVVAVNDAPTAVDSSHAINTGDSLVIDAPGVLAGAMDVDGDPLNLSLIAGPDHAASFTLNADGSFSYTHNGDAVATDQFQVMVDDGNGGSVTVTVTINFMADNQSPVLAASLPVTVFEDSSVIITTQNLQVTDAESPAAGIVFTIENTPSEGMLLLESTALGAGDTFTQADVDSGRLRYLHIGIDAPRTDVIGLRATDADGGTLASLALVINVNDSGAINPDPLPPGGPLTSVPTDTQTGTGATADAVQDPADTAATVSDQVPGDSAPPELAATPETPVEIGFAIRDADQVATQSGRGQAPLSTVSRVLGLLREGNLGLGGGLMTTALDQALLNTDFQLEINRIRETFGVRIADEHGLVASSIAMSTGLSIGYVIWLVRGGVLVSSMLSSLPAWRMLDPLPVLAGIGRDRDDDEDDSLQSMLDKAAPPPAPVVEPERAQ